MSDDIKKTIDEWGPCDMFAAGLPDGYEPEIMETISIPVVEFFEDMDVLELGIDIGPFYEYAEVMSEVPMVDVIYQGNKHRVAIHDMHKDKPIEQQRKIASYAIRWKRNMK